MYYILLGSVMILDISAIQLIYGKDKSKTTSKMYLLTAIVVALANVSNVLIMFQKNLVLPLMITNILIFFISLFAICPKLIKCYKEKKI